VLVCDHLVMAAESISLRAAAENLGLHYMTVYRYVRTGRLAASKQGGQWFVDPADIEAIANGDDSLDRSGVRTRAPGQLEDRLLAADEAGAWAVVSQALTSGAEPSEIHLRMLIPAMKSIGAQWQRGDIEVFDEHQATVVASRITARLGPRFHRRGPNRGLIVVGLISGDAHALTTAIIADLLRGRRFEVTDLGADTPAESFLEVMESATLEQPLVGVVISSTNTENLQQAKNTIATIRARQPDAVVALGGTGVPSRVEAEAAGATIWAPDVERLLEQFDEIAPPNTRLT